MSPTEKIQFNRQLQAAIDESPRFQPALRIFGGHGQTLAGHFLTTPPAPSQWQSNARLINLKLPDGDELLGRCFAAQNTKSPKAVAHVFHGLAGSTDSKYMPRAAAACCELGLKTILWNHRGCGEGRGRAIGTYHSGRSDDLSRAVLWGRQQFPELPQIVIGFSLSGNATILLSAGLVPSHSSKAHSKSEMREQFHGDLPDFSIAVNPPLDLYKSAQRLSYGGSRLYGQRFMVDLLECLQDREAMSVDQQQTKAVSLQEIAIRAKRQLRPWNSVLEFDRLYTGLAGGFKDHIDYYTRASSGQALGRQQVPLVVLTADDDPITHGVDDVPADVWKNNADSFVLDRQAHGGHMGFVNKELLSNASTVGIRWMERRLQLYVEHYLKMYLANN